VSVPPTVRPHQREEVRAALAAGQVIVVPDYGGYQLAAAIGSPGALVRLQGMVATVPPVRAAVGHQADAIALATFWSNEARLLTDRMWPGPLTLIVPGPSDEVDWPGGSESEVHVAMPSSRSLRLVCREGGPWAVATLRRADGRPAVTADDVRAALAADDVALIVDGGSCAGSGPTVVDCTASPPTVRHVGALPESFVDAALMMGNRRPRWFGRRERKSRPS
jgi:L-threonylcarbamoyladenylate synthase